MQNVLPSGSVNSLFSETNLNRMDDIVIASMQAELVTACLVPLLKSMIVSCTLAKRKYINERDIVYARAVAPVPRSTRTSAKQGYLLETRQFGKLCISHIDIIADLMNKNNLECGSIKISSEILLHIQEEVEAHIRGCFEHFSKNCKSGGYSYRLFDIQLAKLMGEPTDARDNITFASLS